MILDITNNIDWYTVGRVMIGIGIMFIAYGIYVKIKEHNEWADAIDNDPNGSAELPPDKRNDS